MKIKLVSTQRVFELFSVCLLVCALPAVPPTAATLTSPGNELDLPTPRDTGDFIMQEDAAEVFHNVDIQKYNDLGIECPPAVAPERGYLEGEGERVGAIVYVRCVRGYRLHGPTVMACRPSGERTAHWSPDVPRECRVDDDEGSDEDNNSDNPDSTGNSNYLDQAIIKSRGNPHFLQPDSQFWQAQKKRRGRLGLTEEEKTAERREEVESLPASCRLRPLAGPCRGAVRRYFFDPAAMECHQFVYGGCQGNSNNFQTIDECNKKCQTRE